MDIFVPKNVIIEEQALDYPLGKKILADFQERKVKVEIISSLNRVKSDRLKSDQEKYREAKATLVVGVRKSLTFQTCKPSAHYQLPLATSCPGMCEYCYLQTTLGKRPFVRVYVNQEEILARAKKYISARSPEATVFEGAATSDPLAVEPYSGGLAKAIKFFGQENLGRFRFVTKFTTVDSLLGLNHGGHTRFRISLNTGTVIRRFEHQTPPLPERLAALKKVAEAGYPVGIIIAPILFYEGWQEDYRQLVREIGAFLPDNNTELTFELISHRYTQKAKNNILSIFPNTVLPLDEKERRIKYGQFGYLKYIYPAEIMADMKKTVEREIENYFPQGKIEYFI